MEYLLRMTMFCQRASRSQVQATPVMFSVEHLLRLTMFCKSVPSSKVRTTLVMCPIMKHLLRLTMFYKSALRSQVLTALVMYHDYIGTLTEVDDVLQE